MITRVALVLIALFAAQRADACSCSEQSGGLVAQLQEAKAQSEVVFYGRVVKTESTRTERGWSSHATFEVLEVFKGKLAQRVQMASDSNGAGCAFSFEPDGRYLVYAIGMQTGHCTRSRRIEDTADVELTWLRTGQPPPAPVVVQREQVECEACSGAAVAEKLAGPNQRSGGTVWNGIEDAVAAEELKAKHAFWTGGRFNFDDPTWTDIVGLSKDGRAFRLVVTPAFATFETCQQRVTLTYCSRLKPRVRSRALPQFECLNPGPPQVMCDEPATTRRTPLEPESLDAVRSCDWRDATAPRCRLDATTHPADGGTPRFMCSPVRGGEAVRDYVCRVKP